MRVVVIGAGFVGTPLCALLRDRGHEAFAVTRTGEGGGLACDVGDPRSVAALSASVGGCDAIVHCASSGRGAGDRSARYRSVYLRGCENLLAEFSPRRMVFASSSSVYGQEDGSWVDEQAETSPAAATGAILLEAEDVVTAAGGAVARLAGIYGPGRSVLLRRFLEGAAQIDGDTEDSLGRWINQIHREDAASALTHLTDPGVEPGIYNVADDRPLTQRECYAEFVRRFGGELPPVRSPDRGRSRGWSDKRVSNTKLRATGWVPRYPSYFEALDTDGEIAPSIVAQLRAE